MRTTALRYARTLRRLRPWQVAGRLVAAAKRKAGLTRIPAPPVPLVPRLLPRVPFPTHEPWNTREAIRTGRFRFLNEAADLGRPVDWTAAGRPLLWRFNLHYFHYLHLLTPDEQEELCRSWATANPPGKGVGWHPYPTALRIVNWSRAGVSEPELLASLYRQAAFLFRNLETYIGGNHLLENARALVVAGLFFEGQGEAPRWLAKGLDLYRRETREQILPDGGHYERSPMYHALMLEGYLDVLNVLPHDHPDRVWLLETAKRMGDALATMTHPDGRLALFNDATHEIALSPEALTRYLHALTGHTPRARVSLPDTGYFTHRDEEICLIIDGGPVGPDHLLAHAHADVFSYELAVGGERFVVDSGVFEYPAGPMRAYVRSTEAHNTVCIDGLDQVECWDSFRVARRFAPEAITFEQSDGATRFEGTFGGYARLIGDGLRHHRQVRVEPGRRRITVRDRVEGRGRHRVESRIHLHPSVTVTPEDDGFMLRRGDATCRIVVEAGAVQVTEGWHCPRFGVCERNPVLVLGDALPLPAELVYRIEY
ncbi:heparinase II/III family protein [Rhodocaloribacter sp.]